MPDSNGAAATRPSTAWLAFRVFLPFAAGYFLSYMFRTVNAVIAPRLVADVGLSATDLGLMTSAYFLSFAAFQIPLGVLLDRYGPRRAQAVLLVVAGVGAALFSIGESRDALLVARALIGFGVSGGLMASFKAITLWFDQRRWPVVNGFILGTGGVGAMTATKPVELMLGITDWRGVFLILCVACFAVSLFIAIVVPERQAEGRPSTLGEQLRGVGSVFKDRLFWRLTPVCALTGGGGLAIHGLWSGPWLRDVGGFDETGVANRLLALSAVMTVGFVASGIVANQLVRRGLTLTQVMAGGMVLFILSQAAIVFQVDPTGMWHWVGFGLTNHMAILAYPVLSAHFPEGFAGRSNTAINMITFCVAFASQSFVGAVLDLWPTTADGGYAQEGYMASFGIILALQVVAFAWLLLDGRRGTRRDPA